MDALAELALTALVGTLDSLLLGGAPAGLTPSLRVRPVNVATPGIGGFVGTQLEPAGSIFARRVAGTVELDVAGGTDPEASAYLDGVIRALLTEDRGRLRKDGINLLRPNYDAQSPRQMSFDVDYEYRHLPSTADGVIDTLALDLVTNVTPYAAKFRWELDASTLVGAAQPLADFQVTDEAGISSSWSFDAAGARIVQGSASALGALDLSEARKVGPELVVRPGGRPLRPARFIASVDFESASPDGVGLVFARENTGDCLYFLASARHQYQLFARKSGAVFTFVGAPATGIGFTQNVRHELALTVYDRTLIAELDGVRTLSVEAPLAVPSGELGFLTHANAQAAFFGARVIELV